MGKDISHRRQATPAASQCHSGSPPATDGMPQAATSTTAGMIRLHSTTAMAFLAADETQAVVAKMCCNKDAPRFPRWLTSTRAAERAWLLKRWGRKAGAKTGEGRGREERTLTKQTCLRTRSDFCPSTTIVMVLCSTAGETYITEERRVKKGGKRTC